ncbi:MAG: dihydropteroate synthase [Chloroflexi bacterium]|nr:dihydropteroate synthase [Chloroflexota bacterium]
MKNLANLLNKERPLIMGIVNVTPDSFSDGGHHSEPWQAVAFAQELIEKGAHIIDIGGESTHPGYQNVNSQEELRRVLPVIKALKDSGVILSIDTQKANVASAAIKAGAHIINDVSGLSDMYMAATVANLDCYIILTANENLHGIDKDIVKTVKENLQNLLQKACQAGIKKEHIILDIGLGFGKTSEQNWLLIKELACFKDLEQPLVVGASRKSFIGVAAKEMEPQKRLGGTLAVTALAVERGVDIVRVHDVADNLQAVNVVRAILNMKDNE